MDPKLLRAGDNILAVQGLNNSATSSDFSLIPVLEGLIAREPDEERDR